MSSEEKFPSIPGFYINSEGDYVSKPEVDERFDNQFIDFNDDDYESDSEYRAWRKYNESEYTQSLGFGGSADERKRPLYDTVNSRMKRIQGKHRKEVNKPAEEGWKGGFNKLLPFLALPPDKAELAKRSRKLEISVQELHKKTVRQSIKEIVSSDLDIMSDGKQSLAPAIAVESQKGGSGKTTIIISMAELFSRALYVKQKKHNGEINRPGLIVDVNPDYGTLTNRIPEMINEFGNKLNLLDLSKEIEEKKDDPGYKAIDSTFPTKWNYLRAVPGPKSAKDREQIRRRHVESIYDATAKDCSVFLMDNGTDIESFQNISSVGLANAVILVVEATSEIITVINEIHDHKRLEDDNQSSFKGIMNRLVVAIVIKQDRKELRVEAENKRKKLAEQGVSSVIIPFEPSLALSKKIELFETTPEYQAAIGCLANMILGFLNKAK